jgi:hypothetical protein
MTTVEILQAVQKDQDAEAIKRESEITKDAMIALAKLHGQDEELANSLAQYMNLLGDRLNKIGKIVAGSVPVIDMNEP